MEIESGHWIEIRPLPNGRFDAGNFRKVLESLYSNQKPFRFFMVNCKSTVEDHWTVKFFLELADEHIAQYIAKYLRASMDVEVVEAEPPTKTYECCVDFEMRDNYALPICQLSEKIQDNNIDRIVAALSLEESAVEVTAVADPKAKEGIRDYILRITGLKKSLSQILLDMATGIMDAIIGSPPKPKQRERLNKKLRLDPTVKAKAEAAERKMEGNLFTCTLKAYGGVETLKRIKEALPTQMNGFKKYKTLKLAEAPSKLVKPKKNALKNALNNLCWITPTLLIFTAIYYGLLNPLRLNTLDMLITVAVICSGIPFYIIFRKRMPIVLTAMELSLLAGLPTEVKRLPVELGGAIHTRAYLPKEQGFSNSSDETQTRRKLPKAEFP